MDAFLFFASDANCMRVFPSSGSKFASLSPELFFNFYGKVQDEAIIIEREITNKERGETPKGFLRQLNVKTGEEKRRPLILPKDCIFFNYSGPTPEGILSAPSSATLITLLFNRESKKLCVGFIDKDSLNIKSAELPVASGSLGELSDKLLAVCSDGEGRVIIVDKEAGTMSEPLPRGFSETVTSALSAAGEEFGSIAFFPIKNVGLLAAISTPKSLDVVKVLDSFGNVVKNPPIINLKGAGLVASVIPSPADPNDVVALVTNTGTKDATLLLVDVTTGGLKDTVQLPNQFEGNMGAVGEYVYIFNSTFNTLELYSSQHSFHKKIQTNIASPIKIPIRSIVPLPL